MLVVKGRTGDLVVAEKPVVAAPKTELRPPIGPIQNVRDVIAIVAYCHGMTLEELLSERRFKEQVHARQLAVHLVLQVFPHVSLCRIAKVMNRDHTTIMHARDMAKCRWKTEPNFRIDFQVLKDEVERRGVMHPKAVAA